LCDELTLNETVWPTEILRFVGVNAKPLCVMVLVGAVAVVVVVVGIMREIVFDDDFAGKLFALAIFNVNTHEPVDPIVSFDGFLAGVNIHEPLFNHVFAPGEFVETRADKFLASPAIKDETFHVTVVDGAAPAEPPTKTPAKMPTRRKRDFGEMRIPRR
jgi:hypothetical protein